MTLNQYLSEVSARVERATPGPWFVCSMRGCDGYIRDSENKPPIYVPGAHRHSDALASSALIAHARTDVPRLVAMLRVAMDVLEHIAGDAPCGDPLEPDCCDQCAAVYAIQQLDDMVGGE